jgi:[ribosomal protein S5]-alanine N-acetyltransferase
MLTGNTLTLRGLKLSDLNSINCWRNDLELKLLTLGFRLPVSVLKDEEWLKKVLLSTSNAEVYFALEEIATSEFVGVIQLNNINYISGTADWGFIIGDKNKRGKGYGVEASKLVFSYAFNILNLRKLTGYSAIYNIAPLKMQEKIGLFHEEGVLKNHIFYKGKYYDVVIRSFFKEDNDFKDELSFIRI